MARRLPGTIDAASPLATLNWKLCKQLPFEENGWDSCRRPRLRGMASTVEGVDLFCKAGSQTLGYDLRTGQPVKKDPAAAFRQMSQSAEKGYVPAQAHLGMLYANGKGVEQDYRLARQWFAKAGEAGHALAKDSMT